MADYIYLIHPLRDGFFNQPTLQENAIMDEHFEYLQKSAESGQLILAGPCLDDTFGVVIFQAEDDAAASRFMFNDPSVAKNVMMAELHPLRISLRGT